VPNSFCSVCALSIMAKTQELKASDLTEGTNTCQPQSFNDTEDTVESKGLSASSGVENLGLSDSADVQSKGSSHLWSIESHSMSNAVLSADEDRECVPENSAVKTPVEDECEQCETVMETGQVHTTAEQSVEEHVDTGPESLGNGLDVAQEITGNDMLSATNCVPCSDESNLPNGKAVTASEVLLSQETAVVEDPAGVDQSLVPDSHLGELLSCAECGSSGLYFFIILGLVINFLRIIC